jgi:hypothetical protein
MRVTVSWDRFTWRMDGVKSKLGASKFALVTCSKFDCADVPSLLCVCERVTVRYQLAKFRL